jgi:hypothetical protein
MISFVLLFRFRIGAAVLTRLKLTVHWSLVNRVAAESSRGCHEKAQHRSFTNRDPAGGGQARKQETAGEFSAWSVHAEVAVYKRSEVERLAR